MRPLAEAAFHRLNFPHSSLSLMATETVRQFYSCVLILTFRSAMLRGADIFPSATSDSKVAEVKAWLKMKGVYDFEHVSLFSDQLTKVSTIYPQTISTSTPNASKLGHGLRDRKFFRYDGGK